MPITLKDVAERAGLSKQTVSNVLGNNGQLYNAATRERVQEAARELGYRPNGAARAIFQGRFNCVGLLLSQFKGRSTLFQGVLDGICDALDEHDLHLTLARYPEAQSEEFSPKFLRQHMCDGLIINYNDAIPESLLREAQRALPAVWMNSKQEADCVRPDDFQAGHDATKQLIELGHKRIVWTAHEMSHFSGAERRAGYEAAMKKARLKPIIMRGPQPDEGWLDVASELLRAPQRPTAFVNYSGHTGQPLLGAARLLKLRVPEKLSLVTFGDAPFYDPLTSRYMSVWQWPEREVGRQAIEMLLSKIESPASVFAPRVIPFTPGSAETIAPAPKIAERRR